MGTNWKIFSRLDNTWSEVYRRKKSALGDKVNLN